MEISADSQTRHDFDVGWIEKRDLSLVNQPKKGAGGSVHKNTVECKWIDVIPVWKKDEMSFFSTPRSRVTETRQGLLINRSIRRPLDARSELKTISRPDRFSFFLYLVVELWVEMDRWMFFHIFFPLFEVMSFPRLARDCLVELEQSLTRDGAGHPCDISQCWIPILRSLHIMMRKM